jgi:hypothetical protein
MSNKILLMGKNGEYYIAKKNKEENNLVPSSKKVFARETVPYGFGFKFGHNGENLGIMGYISYLYHNKGKDGNYPKDNEEYSRINLDLTIKGLEKKIKEKGADYILVDDLFSKDMGTSWDIYGKAQLLIKR